MYGMYHVHDVEKNRWTQDKKTCNSVTTVVFPCAVLPINYSDESSVVNVGDAVARIPIALALSHVAARTYRVNDQPVGTLLRPLFNEQPTYALGKFVFISVRTGN